MKSELVQTIREIQQQESSGILTANTRVSSREGSGIGSAAALVQANFSFLFKEGELASLMCASTQGGSAMTRVALIESVVRTTWTKMKASAIAASKEDVKLSTQLLLKVLGADEVSGELRPSAKAELDRVNAIVARSEIVFLEVFGSRGGAVLQEILSRHDPRENSDVFTAACVSQLEPLLGAQHAQSILQP